MSEVVNFPNLTFAGGYLLELFGQSVIDPAGLLENDLALPLDQTKYKTTLNEINDTIELQDPSAKFSDQASTPVVDEVNIEAVPYEFHRELSWDTIRKTWLSQQLRAGSLEDYSPATINEDFIANVYQPKLAAVQSHLICQGKTGVDPTLGSISFSQPYTGLYEVFNNSSVVSKLSIANDQIAIASVQDDASPTVVRATGDFTEALFAGNLVSVRKAAGTGWTALNTDLKVLAVTLNGGNTDITLAVDTSALDKADYTGGSAQIRFINRTNIVQKMANHYGFVPTQIRRNGGKIVIPAHLENEWQFANALVSQNSGDFVRTSYQLQLIQSSVVVLDDAPINTIGTWPKNRVGYVYDLKDDVTNIEMNWLGDIGDKVYRLRSASKTGISISKLFADEITLSTPEKD